LEKRQIHTSLSNAPNQQNKKRGERVSARPKTWKKMDKKMKVKNLESKLPLAFRASMAPAYRKKRKGGMAGGRMERWHEKAEIKSRFTI